MTKEADMTLKLLDLRQSTDATGMVKDAGNIVGVAGDYVIVGRVCKPLPHIMDRRTNYRAWRRRYAGYYRIEAFAKWSLKCRLIIKHGRR